MPTAQLDLTGYAEKMDTASSEARQKIVNGLDRDAVLSLLVKQLNDNYTLFYADYDSKFDSETIAKFINANDPQILDESLDEWYYDNQYTSADYIINDLYDDDERAVIDALDLRHEIRDEIRDRDDSDPVRALLRHSSDHFCYVTILDGEPYDDDSITLEGQAWNNDKPELEYRKIAKASGLSMHKPKERKAIIELYQNGKTSYISPLVWFFSFSPIDYYDALMKQYKSNEKDIQVTLHSPSLAIRDSWNGTGYDIATDKNVTVPLSSIKSDEKGNGYSYANDVCGLVRSAYEISISY